MQRQVKLAQHEWPVIGLAAEHHPVAPGERVEDGARVAKASVDDNGQTRECSFKRAHDVIAQRRYGAVLFWRQSPKHRFACMHDGAVASGSLDRGNKTPQRIEIVVVE